MPAGWKEKEGGTFFSPAQESQAIPSAYCLALSQGSSARRAHLQPFAPHYFLIMFLVHLWPRRFPISFPHLESGEDNMIAAHTRGSADSGSAQRTQIAFPLENALAVLTAPEGCSALVISCASDAGEGRK